MKNALTLAEVLILFIVNQNCSVHLEKDTVCTDVYQGGDCGLVLAAYS